jgi:peptidoglycan/xylan/chitin deacetylase (PgdA/CDA1 family)
MNKRKLHPDGALLTMLGLERLRPLTVASVTAGAVIGGMSATAAYGSVSRSSQLFGPSVYRGVRNRPSIALTFDDGPSEGTLPLLDYLSQQGVTATFFQCGLNVKRHPRIAGRVVAAGHQIGNHTYSHPSLAFKSKQFIDREFTQAQEVIQCETGITPMILRAPYGFRWFGMREVQEKLSLLGVMWTIMGYDWRWNADRIATHILERVSPGAIICLHDGRAVTPRPNICETLTAIRYLVPILKDQGYSFEIVSDILNPDFVPATPLCWA